MTRRTPKSPPKRNRAAAPIAAPSKRKLPAPKQLLALDKALAAEWRRSLATLTRETREESVSLDARYEKIAAICDHEPPLYVFGGCKTFTQFCREFVHEPPRTVQRRMRLARVASPEIIAKHGTTLLDAALDYIELKQQKPLAIDARPDLDRFRLTLQREDRTRRVPLDELTVADLRKASRALRRESEGSLAKRPAVVHAVVRALRKTPAKSLSVSYNDGALRFGPVPLFALHAFAHALLEVEPDSDQRPAKSATKSPSPKTRSKSAKPSRS
ncbi:MAG: hypothetical protein Q8Q09_20700 [Deltaproteobacteria bacterium]|nr:hypothetical protein [Deltaproteobacteria bacterium]